MFIIFSCTSFSCKCMTWMWWRFWPCWNFKAFWFAVGCLCIHMLEDGILRVLFVVSYYNTSMEHYIPMDNWFLPSSIAHLLAVNAWLECDGDFGRVGIWKCFGLPGDGILRLVCMLWCRYWIRQVSGGLTTPSTSQTMRLSVPLTRMSLLLRSVQFFRLNL